MDEIKRTKTNLWMFPLGTVGRDMIYSLFNNFLLTYVLFTRNLTAAQLSAITVIMVAARVFDALNDPIMGNIIDKTRTAQGKARPWLLLSAPLVTITGILLFTGPSGSETLQVWWVMISYNLYYSLAYTIFNMSHNLMVPLSTRNTTQRGSLGVFNQISTIMMSGILVALVFPMVFMPMLGVDKGKWITLMSALSIIALPLTLLEYYFTKERVTEEAAGAENDSVTFILRLKIILTDKYMLVTFAYFLIYTIGTSFKNLGLVYYCNYVLGSYNDGGSQQYESVLYQVVDWNRTQEFDGTPFHEENQKMRIYFFPFNCYEYEAKWELNH